MKYFEDENADLYYLYDQVMFGQKPSLGKELFLSSYNGRKEYTSTDQQRAIEVIKYAFECYMGWTPEQTAANISEDILKHLHLNGLVSQRIKFPAELTPMNNLHYLVHLMYPDEFPYDARAAVENYYDKVISGEIPRFQKGFFATENNEGLERACICFARMLQLARPFSSIREMYNFFSKGDCKKLINEYKLTSACRDLFQFPLDFLHYSLPEEQRDYFYYQNLRYGLVRQNFSRRLNIAQKNQFIATT